MNCIQCHEKATPVIKFEEVIYYICEHCGKSFSVRDDGQASQEEIEQLQQEQFHQVMKNNSYKPLRLRLRGRIRQKGTNTPLYNPTTQREQLFAQYGELRGEG